MKNNDQKTEHAVMRLTQKALIRHEESGTYLLIKAVKDKKDTAHDEWYKKYGPWDLPGGRVNDGEKDLDHALKREIKEEVGIDITGDATILLHEYIILKGNYKALSARYITTVETQDVELSDEHEEYQWVNAAEIMDDKEVAQWIKDTVEKAEALLEKNAAHEKMLRTLAEFDNYKKRSGEQQAEFAKYASEKVIMEMLPVLDNFHAATSFVPEDQKDSPWLTGIMYIQQQMEKVFDDAGVQSIEIAEGDVFDAGKMEAIKSDDDEEEQTDSQKVTKVVQKGYMIGDRVMRAARVEVG